MHVCVCVYSRNHSFPVTFYLSFWILIRPKKKRKKKRKLTDYQSGSVRELFENFKYPVTFVLFFYYERILSGRRGVFVHYGWGFCPRSFCPVGFLLAGFLSVSRNISLYTKIMMVNISTI